MVHKRKKGFRPPTFFETHYVKFNGFGQYKIGAVAGQNGTNYTKRTF